jgi:hypothetical protein
VSDGELTGQPALLPGESIIVESVGETNWPLIFIFWAVAWASVRECSLTCARCTR